MKRLALALILCLAAAAAPAEMLVLAKETGPVTRDPQSPCEVRKLKTATGVSLEVRDPTGATVWSLDELGFEEKKFLVGDRTSTLALVDIDRDGFPEILAAAVIGPHSSGLFAFRFDALSKTFAPIPCRFPKENLERDCLVSDALQETGGDLVVREDGSAQVIGLIFDEKGREPPVPGLWTFVLQNGAFVHQKTEKLPPPPKK